ncbi:MULTISPECIES: Dyp-type peroxidase [unclassified Microcoleus]|uniref:Dyp-type peroxidase n=1 Tax=unclassified Microcoleus TaxID=2642155 RepID=UPI002FD286D6
MTIDLNQTHIDPNNPQYQNMLEDLQGNILKSHERDYSTHILIKFKSDPDAVKKWIGYFTEKFVMSAKKQWDDHAKFRSNCQEVEGLFANFFLSYNGYKVLGFELDAGGSGEFPSPAFKVGLRQFRTILFDPPVEEWEKSFQNEIHAFILLADNDRDNLEKQAKQVIEEVGRVAEIVHTEVGIVLKNKKGQTIEHFGFRDGVSQPLFLKEDIELAKKQGTDLWDASAPLELVLVKDPFGEAEHSFGSYCVYRKLEQDVRGFREAERELAKKLRLSDQDVERAGALVVGRFRDGTPVTLSPSEQNPDTVPNNFNYDSDRDGMKCPFHAHIRKANPRGDKNDKYQTLEEHRQHRIVRRAVSYGEMPNARDNSLSKLSRFENQLEHLKELKVQPASGEKVGLLFLCFQRDIFNQFMFMQKNWANNQHFVNYTTGLDGIAGQGKKQIEGQAWPKEWGKDEKVPFDFYNFVTMKGGEFFFAPSISFLKNISALAVK